MATCPFCDEQVSDTTVTCPECGNYIIDDDWDDDGEDYDWE